MHISIGLPIAAEVGLVVLLHKSAATILPYIQGRALLLRPISRERVAGFCGTRRNWLAIRRVPGEPIGLQMESEN